MTTTANPKAEEALAILIANTRRTRRAIPLTELARWLGVALNRLGGYSVVADRIGLSPHMLRQFSAVRRLAPSVRGFFSDRRLDSVDAAVHLAMLPENEQLEMATALATRDIDTKDLRGAIRLRRVGAPGSIKTLLTRVKQSKTKKEYVAEFVVRGSHTRESILAAFHGYLPTKSIIRLDIDGRLGRIVLNADGRNALRKAATKLGVSFKHAIPAMLRPKNS